MFHGALPLGGHAAQVPLLHLVMTMDYLVLGHDSAHVSATPSWSRHFSIVPRKKRLSADGEVRSLRAVTSHQRLCLDPPHSMDQHVSSGAKRGIITAGILFLFIYGCSALDPDMCTQRA